MLNSERLKVIEYKDECTNLRQIHEIKLNETKSQFANVSQNYQNTQTELEDLTMQFRQDRDNMAQMLQQQKEVCYMLYVIRFYITIN